MASLDPRLQGKPVPTVSVADMECNNVARSVMKGSDLAFLDQRIPGFQREIINVIGMGVVENVKDPRLAPKNQGGGAWLCGDPTSAIRRRSTARHCIAIRPKRCSSRSRYRGRSSGSKANASTR